MVLISLCFFLAASSTLAFPEPKGTKFTEAKRQGKLVRPHPKFMSQGKPATVKAKFIKKKKLPITENK